MLSDMVTQRPYKQANKSDGRLMASGHISDQGFPHTFFHGKPSVSIGDHGVTMERTLLLDIFFYVNSFLEVCKPEFNFSIRQTTFLKQRTINTHKVSHPCLRVPFPRKGTSLSSVPSVDQCHRDLCLDLIDPFTVSLCVSFLRHFPLSAILKS